MKTITKKWLNLARDDLKVSGLVAKRGYHLHALFLSQQAIEKMLKAIIAENSPDNPPYTHNLMLLLTAASLAGEISDGDRKTLAFLNTFYIEARYPTTKRKLDQSVRLARKKRVLHDVERIFRWLEGKLR